MKPKRKDEFRNIASAKSTKQSRKVNAEETKKKGTQMKKKALEREQRIMIKSQYKYKTPKVDSKLTKEVFKRCLNSIISITKRELITTSSKIRKKFKNLIITKRNLVNDEEEGYEKLIMMYSYDSRLSLFIEEEEIEERIAPHNLPLRIINV